MRRVKQLSTTIKEWGKTKKGKAEENKISWIKEIDLIDKLEVEGNIFDVHSNRRTTVEVDLCQRLPF